MCESIGGSELMVFCDYNGDTHVMTINKETKLDDIFSSLVRRWEEISRNTTHLRYELQNENLSVKLINDEDVEQMIRVYGIFKVKLCRMFAYDIPTDNGSGLVTFNS